MNNIDLELYQEEQLGILKTLDASIKEFLSTVKERHDTVSIKGSVDVNTKKEVIIENVDEFTKSVELLGNVLTKAIAENSYKPQPIEVSNIGAAKADTVKVSNLEEIKGYFEALALAIKQNKPVVNITKQDIVFPTDAKEPIAVRLSDGKEFYKAMMSVVGGGGGGVPQALMRNSNTTLAVTNPDGSNIGGATAWGLNDGPDDTGTYKYYGFSAADGSWKITRKTIATNAWRYATGPSGYSAAWTDRASQTYAIYDEVF